MIFAELCTLVELIDQTCRGCDSNLDGIVQAIIQATEDADAATLQSALLDVNTSGVLLGQLLDEFVGSDELAAGRHQHGPAQGRHAAPVQSTMLWLMDGASVPAVRLLLTALLLSQASKAAKARTLLAVLRPIAEKRSVVAVARWLAPHATAALQAATAARAAAAGDVVLLHAMRDARRTAAVGSLVGGIIDRSTEALGDGALTQVTLHTILCAVEDALGQLLPAMAAVRRGHTQVLPQSGAPLVATGGGPLAQGMSEREGAVTALRETLSWYTQDDRVLQYAVAEQPRGSIAGSGAGGSGFLASATSTSARRMAMDTQVASSASGPLGTQSPSYRGSSGALVNRSGAYVPISPLRIATARHGRSASYDVGVHVLHTDGSVPPASHTPLHTSHTAPASPHASAQPSTGRFSDMAVTTGDALARQLSRYRDAPATSSSSASPRAGHHGPPAGAQPAAGCMDGLSLCADGQSIQLLVDPTATSQRRRGSRGMLGSHARRLAARMPFLRAKLETEDAAPSMALDARGPSAPLWSSARTLRGDSGVTPAGAPGCGGDTGRFSSRGISPTGPTTRLPVVTPKALARAAVNRQLVAIAPEATSSAPALPPRGSTPLAPPAGMSQVLVDRMLTDAIAHSEVVSRDVGALEMPRPGILSATMSPASAASRAMLLGEGPASARGSTPTPRRLGAVESPPVATMSSAPFPPAYMGICRTAGVSSGGGEAGIWPHCARTAPAEATGNMTLTSVATSAIANTTAVSLVGHAAQESQRGEVAGGIAPRPSRRSSEAPAMQRMRTSAFERSARASDGQLAQLAFPLPPPIEESVSLFHRPSSASAPLLRSPTFGESMERVPFDALDSGSPYATPRASYPSSPSAAAPEDGRASAGSPHTSGHSAGHFAISVYPSAVAGAGRVAGSPPASETSGQSGYGGPRIGTLPTDLGAAAAGQASSQEHLLPLGPERPGAGLPGAALASMGELEASALLPAPPDLPGGLPSPGVFNLHAAGSTPPGAPPEGASLNTMCVVDIPPDGDASGHPRSDAGTPAAEAILRSQSTPSNCGTLSDGPPRGRHGTAAEPPAARASSSKGVGGGVSGPWPGFPAAAMHASRPTAQLLLQPGDKHPFYPSDGSVAGLQELSGMSVAGSHSCEAFDAMLDNMQLQVDLAAAATDGALREEATRRDAAKRDADPVKAVTSMVAVLGGKIFLLQGVRLILTLCLLVSSGAIFYVLLEYAELNVPLCLAVVVGFYLLIAGALLLIVIRKGPGQGGLADILGAGARNASAPEQLRAVLPTFEPYISSALGKISALRDGVAEDARNGGGGGEDAAGDAERAASGGGRAGRAGRHGRRRGRSAGGNRSHSHGGASGLQLPQVSAGRELWLRGLETAALQRDNASVAAVAASARNNGGGSGASPGMLAKVADTGAALMRRLPEKHRDSQMVRVAEAILHEIKEYSAAQGEQISQSGAAAARGQMPRLQQR